MITLGDSDPEMPEGAIPNAVVRVVQYVRPDGGLGIATSISSDVPLSQLLGALFMGAIDIYQGCDRGEPRHDP